MSALGWLLVSLAAGVWICVGAVTVYRDHHRIARLETEVTCLQHPTRATSSITMRNGRVATPTLVVCP